jgi:hypothetical protein
MSIGPIVEWNELASGRHAGPAASPAERRAMVARASRIGMAINYHEAAYNTGRDSFTAEMLVGELADAGLAGVICGAVEYSRVPRDGGGWSLMRRRVPRRRAAWRTF